MCGNVCCFLSSELEGGTLHTVRCNMKSRFNRLLDNLQQCMLRFFHLNWRVLVLYDNRKVAILACSDASKTLNYNA